MVFLFNHYTIIIKSDIILASVDSFHHIEFISINPDFHQFFFEKVAKHFKYNGEIIVMNKW